MQLCPSALSYNETDFLFLEKEVCQNELRSEIKTQHWEWDQPDDYVINKSQVETLKEKFWCILLKTVHGYQRVQEKSVLFQCLVFGGDTVEQFRTQETKIFEDWWNMKAQNLVCKMLFHCKVLEKPTLLKSWIIQVSMKFSGTNKALIKIFYLVKDIFSGGTMFCVTYIPKGMASKTNLWNEELLGQYWKCDGRMMQYWEIIMITYLHFRGCEPYWVNY